MKERPILFSADIVKAILDGRKTQTRVVVKPQPTSWLKLDTGGVWPAAKIRGLCDVMPCPYGSIGDRLWVQETWAAVNVMGQRMTMYREANPPPHEADGWWKQGNRMPRERSRITLEITGVKVERLNDISEEDAKAEGVRMVDGGVFVGRQGPGKLMTPWVTAKEAIRDIWESTYGKGSFDARWVWVITFRKVQP